MSRALQLSAIAVICLVIAGAFVWRMTSAPVPRGRAVSGSDRKRESASAGAAQGQVYDVILGKFEDGGYEIAIRYMPELRDPGSLQELREAVRGRARRGIADLRTKLAGLESKPDSASEGARKRAGLQRSIGLLHMYEGQFREAAAWHEKALATLETVSDAGEERQQIRALLGIIALRRGEIDNCVECVGPSACIFPIAREARHKNEDGSREAMKWFLLYLKERSRDLRVLWLLNIAAMTLGAYPDNIPPEYRLPDSISRPRGHLKKMENVATLAGLTSRGPNLAGGSVFDDFNGDGRPDLFTTSLDADLGASLYLNQGKGEFLDHSASAGLGDQVYALNLARADYDNDGDLDVLLLRGGWEKPLRMSLLRNRGDGVFDDVTVKAGLELPIASESAAWGDYDNDGKLDLFVCGEYQAPGAAPGDKPGDPRNRSRLYHNQGDGTFKDVAAAAGVENLRCGKGSAWGDYDDDGKLDLFVSNMGQPCRLYHNEGVGKFKDVAAELGVTGPPLSFSCWFWDFDNDGKLDLYVNDYRARVSEVLLGAMGVRIEGGSRPHLYKNLGDGQFRDVAVDVGLDRPMAPMGANFGDIDDDGFLDLYLGTGDMSYEGLDIKLLFKNEEGLAFTDATIAAGVGHLQKGHGVSFADYDGDGDLDLFVELGGGTPGDQSYNALFRNPGSGRHWLNVKLVGVESNASALGAHIRADVVAADGARRSIQRTIGNNGSFGGNSLVEHIGLGDAAKLSLLTVRWPSGKTQTWNDIPANQLIVITEGRSRFAAQPSTAEGSEKPELHPERVSQAP